MEVEKEILNNSSVTQGHLSLKVYGIVQGVGFRPSVYHSAFKRQLKGTIKNFQDYVGIELEGSEADLQTFFNQFQLELPDLAQVNKLEVEWSEFQACYSVLSIIESEKARRSCLPIPADLRTCEKCLEEFRDPSNRRYGYHLISCTECGPRWSIINSLPYDRANTAMNDFPPCEACMDEYRDPNSRRFHAQNISCQDCGPQLQVTNSKGERCEVGDSLKNGKILALKGIGGYQLICDARNVEAIKKIRSFKQRPHKALAVMTRGNLIADSSEQLNSQESPIVLMEEAWDLPMEEIAPDTSKVGLFLPTSALHDQLFDSGLDFLIVTSANRSGGPMICDNGDAHSELKQVADIFIHHNREITRPVDDSVVSELPIRLGRGHAPSVIKLDVEYPDMLALGGDLKNSFALFSGKNAFLSPYVGDLYDARNFDHFQSMIEDFLQFYQFNPCVIVVDRHPQYLSSEFGRKWARKKQVQLIEVQHHLAHAASVMAEKRLQRANCVVFDGTGYGDDQTLWGGECFSIDLSAGKFERVLSTQSSVLIGGELAVREPRRQALARILELGLPVPKHLESVSLEQVFHKKVSSVPTSSVGRLFDAVSALLLPEYNLITYEAQAALGLEKHARAHVGPVTSYPIRWEGELFLANDLFKQVYLDYSRGEPSTWIAKRFHQSIAEVVKQMFERAAVGDDCPRVVSGGVFQNSLLQEMLSKEIIFPSRLPVNDGGIALGQGVIARKILEATQGRENA